ncbi:hypothetical protein B0T21DRAFT_414791 [Apiosordaria backusii]|uniref:F-box domain-containing protein n=1 Tax=Apiosordaria backusii TaxID=314023 RepID=A0AA40AMT9_9PEZI|nr:hypothetical protein B0T21DRAFT_414791 [Apiosordaria backusii]
MGEPPTKRRKVDDCANGSNNLSPTLKQESPSPCAITRLEQLPKELLLEINDCLEPWEWAALALTSRTMLSKIGSNALRLPKKSLYNLLVLLEKQGIYLSDILCPMCVRFHSTSSATADTSRLCEKNVPGWTRGKGEDPLPSYYLALLENPNNVITIPFNMANAVMRSCNFNISPPLLTANDLDYEFQDKPCSDDSYKWIFYTKCMFRVTAVTNPTTGMEEAHLMMKQRTTVSPLILTSTYGVKEANVNLLQRLEGTISHQTGKYACCPDMKLTRCYLDCFQTDHASGNGCACLWNQNEPCHPFHRFNDWKKPFPGTIDTCSFCGANFWLNFVEKVNEGGRICTLLVWKDLGECRTWDMKWPWPNHDAFAWETKLSTGRSSAAKPERVSKLAAYRAYEGVPLDKKVGQYMPSWATRPAFTRQRRSVRGTTLPAD